ncbi:GumC family protein [Allomesorhizobium alhagi]|uniref:CPSC/CAPB subfamily ATPase n=1 Tax=Mesorhizobium alhagi CCNWXJ12-2 TaxID=1107882 RepID=H0HYK7_9HYPH|nr:GNVR domain-containing protein [Mesorhizobium alhagi]EHK54163.1 CPSC/CAPB subfamily ATPase [Mesorhizobium alhagi CCNWXJ12-2]
MMDRVLDSQWPPVSDQHNSAVQEFIGLSDITEFLRRYLRSIAGCVLVALGLAWFYNATTYPVFTATTQILIEPKLPQLLQQQAAEVNLSLDTAQVESQIAVMQSEKIAAMVIDQLDLIDDPSFNRPHAPTIGDRFRKLKMIVFETFGLDGAWASRIEALLPASASATPPKPLTEFERSRRTMEIFQAGLDVRRVGVSYAINISFLSLDPEAAAKIANATSEAFVREQIETKAEAAKQGGAWLEKRLKELRTQMNAATQEAQEFRSRHDYSVGVGDDPPAEGEEQTPTLEELEVTADTYRKMYESFLHAYTNSVSQQSYPVADARVITAATAPLYPSAPRPKLVLAFGAIAGIMAGVGLAFLRHTFDWTVRSPRQISEQLGLDCIGELPPARRQWPRRPDEVASAPQSRFSHAVRRAKTAISLSETVHPIRWLGVTAAKHGDMKTEFASNLATLYATSGLRTLVIDADLHRPELTARLLGPESFDEERSKCMDPISVNIITAPGRPFDILPVWVVRAKNLLAPRSLQALLSDLDSYDIVIVDLPTLANGSDGLAAGSVLDGVVMAAEWGRTQIDTLRELASTVKASRTTIIGVLLTNVRAAPAKRRA